VSLGLPFNAVVLEPYTPLWAELYAQERTRILSAVGDSVLGIEHVGSTSIPGIRAKPIIDIAVAVQSMRDAEELAPRMALIGYDYAGDGGVPGERIYGRGPRMRTHLVHAVIAAGPEWRNYLQFRDTLRRDPKLARDYSALKRELAEKFADDRRGYTRAKGEFIDRVLQAPPDNSLERSRGE
jgi:GrpB-like predicted nucleotidyltransferase (UPF0157 family)